MQCGTDPPGGESDCEGSRRSKQDRSQAVDDHNFPIKTTQGSNLPVSLGYTAFAPLPDSFSLDPKAVREKPIGAGPLSGQQDRTEMWSRSSRLPGQNKPNVAR